MRAGALLLGTILALLACEAVVRLLDLQPQRMMTKRILIDLVDPSHFYYCYPSNPNDEFQPLPDLSKGRWEVQNFTFQEEVVPIEDLEMTPWCVEFKRNPIGMRDDMVPLDPTPGILRIAGIGDSFAFGAGVQLEMSLFNQMEDLLGEKYEIINTAALGLNTKKEIKILGQVVERMGATRAIVVFVPNDAPLHEPFRERQKYIHDLINIRDAYLIKHEAKLWYTGHLRVIDLVFSALELRNIKGETVRWYLDLYDPAHNKVGLELLQSDLGLLGNFPGCKVAFVMYPLMEDFEGSYPLAPIHVKVARMAREAGLPVLDLLPYFEGKETSTLQVHPTDHHPNGKAHKIAAEAIVDWLRKDLPEFLEGP